MLRMLGADVELSDPFRDFMIGMAAGVRGEGAAAKAPVKTKPRHDPSAATQFADAVCATRVGEQKWSTACRDNIVRIIEMWLTDADFSDGKFDKMLPDAASSIPRNVGYAAQYRALVGHGEERDAYLKFGKKSITFDCSRCQAIAEQVAAEHAPESPKRQLECMYYIKMFDENELGTEAYDTARDWLESHGLKDKLYAAYMSELNLEGVG